MPRLPRAVFPLRPRAPITPSPVGTASASASAPVAPRFVLTSTLRFPTFSPPTFTPASASASASASISGIHNDLSNWSSLSSTPFSAPSHARNLFTSSFGSAHGSSSSILSSTTRSSLNPFSLAGSVSAVAATSTPVPRSALGSLRFVAMGTFYQPSQRKRKRKHGFLVRLRGGKNGRKMLERRLMKGRRNLSH